MPTDSDRKRQPLAQEVPPLAIHVIDERAVYSLESAQRVLRLRSSTIRREVRLGRLRVAKRSGRYFFLGEWLLEWIRAGELKRPSALHATGNGVS